ncbi:hypothetical protein ACFV9C_44270 [Kribbella sp. NPDC059898]|uniref:hypothetical protein n=1 Tax=Kribbella sp. NPDC059898 TaxID=3346995 RepID=UPI00365906BA
MQTLQQLLDEHAATRNHDVLNQLAPDLPPLFWVIYSPHSSINPGEIHGTTQAGTDDDDTASILAAWADRLDLPLNETRGMPGMHEYADDRAGRRLIVWGVTNREDWNAALLRWHSEQQSATVAAGEPEPEVPGLKQLLDEYAGTGDADVFNQLAPDLPPLFWLVYESATGSDDWREVRGQVEPGTPDDEADAILTAWASRFALVPADEVWRQIPGAREYVGARDHGTHRLVVWAVVDSQTWGESTRAAVDAACDPVPADPPAVPDLNPATSIRRFVSLDEILQVLRSGADVALRGFPPGDLYDDLHAELVRRGIAAFGDELPQPVDVGVQLGPELPPVADVVPESGPDAVVSSVPAAILATGGDHPMTTTYRRRRRVLRIQLALSGLITGLAFWQITHGGDWLWALAGMLSGCALVATATQLEDVRAAYNTAETRQALTDDVYRKDGRI